MEAAGILSISEPRHVGAFSTLMKPLMQVGLDRLRAVWNQHRVSGIPGWPGSGGRPLDRVRKYPPPSGRAALPAGFDAVAEYEAVMPALRREPIGAERRDSLYRQPAAQAQRTAAVALAVGGAGAVQMWDEIVNDEHTHFIAAYLVYLSF